MGNGTKRGKQNDVKMSHFGESEGPIIPTDLMEDDTSSILQDFEQRIAGLEVMRELSKGFDQKILDDINKLKRENANLGDKLAENELTDLVNKDLSDLDGMNHEGVQPDADSTETATKVTTLWEYTGSATAHIGELEMKGAQDLADGVAWMPYLTKTSGIGTMAWAKLDNKSVDISTDIQIKDWATASGGVDAGTGDLLVGNSAGVLKYFTPADLSRNVAKGINDSTGGTIITIESEHISFSASFTSHSLLSNLVAPADDHTQYWVNTASGTKSRNKGTSIGRLSDAKLGIDLEGSKLHSGAGETEVLCWDIAGVWQLKFGATNWWKTDAFIVDVTGACGLTTTNKLDMSIGASSAWTLSAGTLNITAPSVSLNASIDIILGGITTPQTIGMKSTSTMEFSGAGTADLYLGGGPSLPGNFDDIYFNGVKGITETITVVTDINFNNGTFTTKNITTTKGGVTAWA